MLPPSPLLLLLLHQQKLVVLLLLLLPLPCPSLTPAPPVLAVQRAFARGCAAPRYRPSSFPRRRNKHTGMRNTRATLTHTHALQLLFQGQQLLLQQQHQLEEQATGRACFL